jgi:hypothetical protein
VKWGEGCHLRGVEEEGGFLSATGDLVGGLPLVDCLSGTGTGGAPWLTRVLRGGWP